MRISVIGLGAGGHAKVMIEILQADSRYRLIGLLDPKVELHGGSILGVPVLGTDALLTELKSSGVEYFFLGVGGASDTKPRRSLYQTALNQGLKPVTAIHVQSIISPSATIGVGATVNAAAVINASARLGDNVIVNTGAIVEHDCVIGSHVHIATGAILAGGVTVRDGAHIGAGAVVREYLNIGAGAVLGAGAVVVKDVPNNHAAVGNPARLIQQN